MAELLSKVVKRCASLSIEQGKIKIRPANGDQRSADQWLAKHHDQLLIEILKATGQRAFRYVGYSTGCYGRHKAGGVTLQLVEVLTGEQLYCVFNVSVRRSRSTHHGKKGAMLPLGHFSAAKGSAFVVFWQRAGLALPRRLSAFNDYMGKLQGPIFTGSIESQGKINKRDLRPLELTFDQIRGHTSYPATLPDKSRTTAGQSPDKSRTSAPDKETAQRQRIRSVQQDSGACENHHGSRLTVTRVTGETLPPEPDPWLLEYEQALMESKPY